MTTTIDAHEATTDDGVTVSFPAGTLAATPGDLILAYIGYGDETDATGTASPAVVTSYDLDTPVTLKFGAYYDPSVPGFTNANGGSGTFVVNGHTYHFNGPYAHIAPADIDLDDEGFADVEVLDYILPDFDHATQQYPTWNPSRPPQVFLPNIVDSAVGRAKTHPSNPHRQVWHNLTVDVTNTTAGSPPTADVTIAVVNNTTGKLVSEDGAALLAQNGAALTFGPAGNSLWNSALETLIGVPAGGIIVFNGRTANLPMNDGAGGTVSPMDFGWVASIDHSVPENIFVYIIGHISIGANSMPGDPGYLYFHGWHHGHHKSHGIHIANRTVVRGIKAGATDSSSARDGVIFTSLDGSVIITRPDNTHIDFAAHGSAITYSGVVTVNGNGVDKYYYKTPWPAGTFTVSTVPVVVTNPRFPGAMAGSGYTVGGETKDGFALLFNSVLPNDGFNYNFSYIARYQP